MVWPVDAEQGGVDRGVEVGVGEHHAGGLAAEFHGQALEVRGGVAEDRLAGGGLAGEGDQRDVRVFDQGVAGFLAEAVDQVENTVREAGGLEDLRPQRG